LVAIGVVAGGFSVAHAQTTAGYRKVQLGSTLETALSVTGAVMADVKVIHARPALLQNLEWRPRWSMNASREPADPVQLAVFSFYNDRLFSVTVDYDVKRTEGLSEADLIEAISGTYGLSPAPMARQRDDASMSGDTFAAKPIARWQDPLFSITLLRTTYPTAFRMVLVFTELSTLAKREKSRIVNKPAFTP
jgi:hypothetical protein